MRPARTELAQAQRSGEYQRAGELTYGVIPGLEKQLAENEAKRAGVLVDEAVTPETSRRSSRAGPAFRSTRCWKASARSC